MNWLSPHTRHLIPLFTLLATAASALVAAPAGAVDPSCPTPITQPTGTVRACSAGHVADLLSGGFKGRIVIPRDVRWEWKASNGTQLKNVEVQSGVEIVGERGNLNSRPTLYTRDIATKYSMLVVLGNDVKISGIHFVGPKPSSTHGRVEPTVSGVQVITDFDDKLGRRILVEESEFEQFSGSGVSVSGTHNVDKVEDWDPAWTKPVRADASLVKIERNYFHDNFMDSKGYGVVVGGGTYATVTANVFDNNRHQVAASGAANSGYVATTNYILHNAIKENGNFYNQHFDVHGTGEGGYGSTAGTYFDIAGNTILGNQRYYLVKTRPALMLRGKVVDGLQFRDNVLEHGDLDSAVALDAGGWTGWGESHAKFNFRDGRNWYGRDYSREIASGDFDGDGRTDVFVANGTGWWFSRAGIAQWELLRPATTRTGDMKFADMDGDRKTDVVLRESNGRVGYSSGGRGAIVPLFSGGIPVPLSEVRTGDFDGDQRTDLFYTYKGQWNVWYAKTRAWTPTQSSNAKISELLFGDFDSVRGTDVLAVRNSQWSISSASTGGWARLNSKLTSNFNDAVVADFDGDGRDDIGVSSGSGWRMSSGGKASLTTMRSGSGLPSLKSLQVGRFDAGPKAVAVGFSGDRLMTWTSYGSGSKAYTRSLNDMR